MALPQTLFPSHSKPPKPHQKSCQSSGLEPGQIVAIAYVNSASDYHAVLLTPVAEVTPTLNITVAHYAAKQALLTVQATYTGGAPGGLAPTLSVYASSTGKPIGTLNTKDGSTYFGSFLLKGKPQTITVMSSDGGRGDATVTEISPGSGALVGRN